MSNQIGHTLLDTTILPGALVPLVEADVVGAVKDFLTYNFKTIVIRLNQASAKMQSIDEVAVIPALFRKYLYLAF